MANLQEQALWETGIYQFETSDPVMGGPDGIDNKPTRQLANRTLYLKIRLETLQTNVADKTIDATAEKAGIAKLINRLDSTATDAALTANQGRILKERIEDIKNRYLPLTGGTISGGFTAQGSSRNFYGIAINNTDTAAQGVYLAQDINGITRGGIETHGNGHGSYNVSLTATAEGDARDRHERVLTAATGYIWTKAYGNLHDHFCTNAAADTRISSLRSEINGRFTHSNYPNHYAGAEVWRMPNGLKITTMRIDGINASGDYYLPEAYQGRAIAVANDVGDGRRVVSSYLHPNSNRVTVFVNNLNVSVNIIVIGWANH